MRMLTPQLPTLSVPIASLAAAVPRQLGAMPFFFANMPGVACASFVPDAVVPWNLYGLKIQETQSGLKRIVRFVFAFSVIVLLASALHQARGQGSQP